LITTYQAILKTNYLKLNQLPRPTQQLPHLFLKVKSFASELQSHRLMPKKTSISNLDPFDNFVSSAPHFNYSAQPNSLFAFL
jgi:hypothetical protein